MGWDDFIKLYNEELNSSFKDEDVYYIYEIVYTFNKELFEEMINLECYKNILKHCKTIIPPIIDYDTILDNLKDIILIGGSQDHSIDNYMDWDGLVNEEIELYYEKFNEEYIMHDDLKEMYHNLRKYCI